MRKNSITKVEQEKRNSQQQCNIHKLKNDNYPEQREITNLLSTEVEQQTSGKSNIRLHGCSGSESPDTKYHQKIIFISKFRKK